MSGLTKAGNFSRKTNQDYRKKGECPFCGSGVYGFDGKEIADCEVISHRIRCDDCRKRWWEVYELKCIEPER